MRLHWYRIGVCGKDEEAGKAIYKCRNGMLTQNTMTGTEQGDKEA